MYHFINDNFHTDIATVPPSYKMKHFHEHNRWELMFIYSGSCTLYVGDEIYMLNPGGLALIPPDMAHMTTYLAGSDHTRYVLYFNNDDLKLIADDSSLDIESIFHKHPVVHIPERRLDYISSIIQKISYEHNGVDSLSLSFIHSYFHELILFNMSESSLSKKFKAFTGFRFREYLIYVRTHAAADLLVNTSLSITEIADKCGFADSNTMGGTFKKIMGEAPESYRKNH